MKKCPKCGREYDVTMGYCLDDGSELLYGPSSASTDEPPTAILQHESPTRAQVHTTDRTAILQTSDAVNTKSRGQRYLIVTILVTVLAVGGYFGFNYVKNGAGGISSIAVLPFENRSGNSDTDYLSDGLTDSLIFRFSQLPNLKVSPTSSVMRFKNAGPDVAAVAKTLDVDAVLSGRLTQLADSLSISVQLIDARTNKLIWAEQYDRKMSDLLSTQREIAATITEKLQLRLSGNEKGITKKYTNNNDAYQLYLKGRFHWAKRTSGDMIKSIESFQQAIELDPNFALAYVGIAEAYNSIGKTPNASPRESIPKAKAAALKALEIDPSLAEAHSAFGDSLSLYDWDWARSELEFNHAIELDPNIGYIHIAYAGTYLTAAGRMEEAVREAERAVELEPLSLINNSVLASIYVLARQYDKARIQARKTNDLDPNFPLSKIWLGMSDCLDGKHEDAVALFKDVPIDSPEHVNALVVTAFAHAKEGRSAEALSELHEIQEISKTKYVRPYYSAWVYTALGDKDKAITELQKSFNERDCFVPRARVDPLLDPLRDDPRFKDLIAKLKLPE